MSDAAQRIRDAVARVNALRDQCHGDPRLLTAVTQVKAFQGRRFTATYRDLLDNPNYASAARFFLEELYGSQDFRDRDNQFGRIAGALERIFPRTVVETALVLAELHALTEELDYAMATEWAILPAPDVPRYVASWAAVGRQESRAGQLSRVMTIGNDLVRLTRTPGLRQLLRLMRRPARAAGLAALQRFLETGFDTFAELAAIPGRAEYFLETIAEREHRLISALSAGAPTKAEATLADLFTSEV